MEGVEQNLNKTEGHESREKKILEAEERAVERFEKYFGLNDVEKRKEVMMHGVETDRVDA